MYSFLILSYGYFYAQLSWELFLMLLFSKGQIFLFAIPTDAFLNVCFFKGFLLLKGFHFRCAFVSWKKGVRIRLDLPKSPIKDVWSSINPVKTGKDPQSSNCTLSVLLLFLFLHGCWDKIGSVGCVYHSSFCTIIPNSELKLTCLWLHHLTIGNLFLSLQGTSYHFQVQVNSLHTNSFL